MTARWPPCARSWPTCCRRSASAPGTPAAAPTPTPPTARPYIDVPEPGRLVVALGGNGRGAQAADAVGQLTSRLALTGRWQSDLPHDAFRPVPADGSWNGMTLLRDQAR
ncbi:MAG TPA: hypothetical protein VFV73_19930 [Streptosporangiaceae bacterium]|nr:hypothetical protein [Streptosporangiaceae bacterium]